MKKRNRVPDSCTIRPEPDSEKNIGYPMKLDRDRISGTSLVVACSRVLEYPSLCGERGKVLFFTANEVSFIASRLIVLSWNV